MFIIRVNHDSLLNSGNPLTAKPYDRQKWWPRLAIISGTRQLVKYITYMIVYQTLLVTHTLLIPN
jgi:hypothetical protein